MKLIAFLLAEELEIAVESFGRGLMEIYVRAFR